MSAEHPAHSPLLQGVAFWILAPFFALLPWDLYQRVPCTEMTFSRVLGGIVLLLWAASLAVRLPKARLRVSNVQWPLLVLAGCAGLSYFVSEAPHTTASYLRLGLAYVALVYAVRWAVREKGEVRLLMGLFTASAAGAGLLTLACQGGILRPVCWYTAYWPEGPLIEEWRAGMPLRMAAASPDLNQAAVVLSVGFAWGLLVLAAPGGSRLARASGWLAAAVCFLGVLSAMSRAALLLMVALAVAYLPFAARTPRARLAVLFLISLGCLLVVAYYRDFFSVLLERARGGLFRDDGSVRNRLIVYRAALALVPRYWICGAGLGASDDALARHFPQAAALGQVIHSTHLKMLIELGVAGFVAYLALWTRAARQATAALHSADDTITRWQAGCTLAILLVLFCMLGVQPFQIMLTVPAVISLLVSPSPTGAKVDTTMPSRRTVTGRRALAAWCSCALTIVVVGFNCSIYQRTFARTAAFADTAIEASRNEPGRHWSRAEQLYASAQEQFYAAGDRALAGLPYFEEAAKTVDLARVRALVSPAVADSAWPVLLGEKRARLLLLLGNTERAGRIVLSIGTADPRHLGMKYDVAESWWARGAFREALLLYSEAAEVADDRSVYSQRRTALMSRLLVLSDVTDLQSALARGVVLRRLGKWEDAVALYASLAAQGDPPAEALFHLGVQDELAGEVNGALRHYQRAREADPGHIAAGIAIARLTSGKDRPR